MNLENKIKKDETAFLEITVKGAIYWERDPVFVYHYVMLVKFFSALTIHSPARQAPR